MAELAIDRIPAHNSLERPVGFHWRAMVDSAAAMDTAVVDTVVAGIAIVDSAAGTVVDIAVVDMAAGMAVVDSFVAAASRRMDWKLESVSTAELEIDVGGLAPGLHAENPRWIAPSFVLRLDAQDGLNAGSRHFSIQPLCYD
jgi:hypothetical protein